MQEIMRRLCWAAEVKVSTEDREMALQRLVTVSLRSAGD
ncbi:hypothetical protein JL2886_02083 [Phaeobacter gallaeciensis]|uniref:Uncharacterized protein n=1 Tax=Phaeobacter gallaeciensis TaxID=60890 RepID=A0A1B0ZS31_9RHOB|nr:hypothetical protein JL2886_02083 [Phaeobacter gallaeciensis]